MVSEVMCCFNSLIFVTADFSILTPWLYFSIDPSVILDWKYSTSFSSTGTHAHKLGQRSGDRCNVCQRHSSTPQFLSQFEMCLVFWNKQELPGKICHREVPREIRLCRGEQPRGKVWLPVGKFPDNSWGFSTVCQTSGFKTDGNVSRGSCLNIFRVYRRVVWQC